MLVEWEAHKSDKPEPRRACLEITNYKSQITNKLQIPISKITNSPDRLLRTLENLSRISKRSFKFRFVICNLWFVICL
jgi:hypothetical protein